MKRQSLGLSAGSTGAVSEMLVAADLMKIGYEVYRAVSPSSFCDLVAMKRGDFRSTLYVEVRTGYKAKSTGDISCARYPGEEIKQFAIVIYGDTTEIVYEPPLV